jgi:hypothetical protein
MEHPSSEKFEENGLFFFTEKAAQALALLKLSGFLPAQFHAG